MFKIVKDSSGKEYIFSEQTELCYHTETSKKVIEVIDRAFLNKDRIQIYYGDKDTGRDWNEEHDVTGTIGRSTGSFKIPLMINNARSAGGPGILDHCIIKIKNIGSATILYQHPNYKQPVIEIVPSDLEGYTHNTIVNGQLHGRHKSLRSAQILKRKLS